MKKTLPKLVSAKLVLGICLLLISFRGAAQSQGTLIIGTATTSASTNVLLSTSTTTSNKYARTIAIYSAAEIKTAKGGAGPITKIAWFKDGTDEYPTADAQLTIYIKGVKFTAHGASPVGWDTAIVGAKQVYKNTALSLPTGVGWKEFVFSSPFIWNGTDNIEVFVDWYRASAPTFPINWRYHVLANTNASQVSAAQLSAIGVINNRPNVQFTMAKTTGLTEDENYVTDLAQLYPNPFSGQELTLIIGPAYKNADVKIQDALGREVYRQQLNATDLAGQDFKLNIAADLPKGIYFATVTSGRKFQILKLLKQ